MRECLLFNRGSKTNTTLWLATAFLLLGKPLCAQAPESLKVVAPVGGQLRATLGEITAEVSVIAGSLKGLYFVQVYRGVNTPISDRPLQPGDLIRVVAEFQRQVQGDSREVKIAVGTSEITVAVTRTNKELLRFMSEPIRVLASDSKSAPTPPAPTPTPPDEPSTRGDTKP